MSMTKPVSAGQIGQQLDRQSAELDELHGSLSQLENALTPILLSRAERAEVAPGDAPREVMASLAECVASHTDTIVQATRRVRTLLGAIEL